MFLVGWSVPVRLPHLLQIELGTEIASKTEITLGLSLLAEALVSSRM